MLWGWGNGYSHQVLMEMRTVVLLGENNLETSIKKYKYHTLQHSALTLGNLSLGK